MARTTIRGVDIDPAAVTAVRAGNRLEPGLAAFTGVSFFVYLLVKAASGATPVDAALYAQVALSAALLGIGGGLMWRGRYFYVEVFTAEGRRRIGGLSKGEQAELVERLSAR